MWGSSDSHGECSGNEIERTLNPTLAALQHSSFSSSFMSMLQVCTVPPAASVIKLEPHFLPRSTLPRSSLTHDPCAPP